MLIKCWVSLHLREFNQNRSTIQVSCLVFFIDCVQPNLRAVTVILFLPNGSMGQKEMVRHGIITFGTLMTTHATLPKLEGIVMFKTCLKKYPIAVGILALFFVSLFGYRAYQGHRDFEDFMSGVRAFQQSIDKGASSSDNTADDTEGENHANDLQEGDSIPTVKVMKHTNVELGQNPSISPEDKDTKSKRSFTPRSFTPAEMVKKSVRTPDGEIHTIWLPPSFEVKDGDEVSVDLFTRLPPPNFEKAMAKGIVIKHSDVPEGESIDSYMSDLFSSNLYGISVEDVKRRRESGDVRMQVIHSESHPIAHPVEEFIDNEPLSRPVPENASAGGTDGDTDTATVRSDVSASPSDLSRVAEPTPSPPSMSDIEKQLTPQRIESELSEGLSPNRFDKAQQLIDQYGAEEGLRRLRESDPEAARQFERERRPVPSRDVQDGRQPESGSKD